MIATAATLAPLQGETQVAFMDRALRTLPGSTDHKTAVAMAAWSNSGRDAHLEQIVRQRFPASKFRRVRNRPVFVEHTKPRMKRDPVTGHEYEVLEKYDRDALAAIVDRCNERILDTGDFSPLTEGHTPDPEEVAKGARVPDVLGYSGPYRLGMIGNKKPRWAVFCDEFQHLESVPKLDRMTRRSPEVWLEERMQDRFFDPIAALGAETPRLDTGLGRFGRRADGRLVEKYSAAAVAPSGANTFIPSDGGERKREYAADAQPSDNGAKPMMSPEDVKMIVDAIEQLPWVQFVKEQMGAQAGGGPDEAAGAGAAPPPSAPAEPPPPPAPDQNAAGMPPAPPMGAPGAAPPPPMAPQQQYQCDDDDKSMASRYAAGEVSDDEFMDHFKGRKESYAASLGTGTAVTENPGKPAGTGEVADRAAYSRSEHDTRVRYARLERDHNELKSKVNKLEREKRDQYRRGKLLERQAEGYVFDLDEELKDTGDLSDPQFERHLARVERYERSPLGTPVLFTPPLDPPKTDKYQLARVEGIKKLAAEKGCSWDEAKRQYDQQNPVAQAS